jgi:hypothetical protein
VSTAWSIALAAASTEKDWIFRLASRPMAANLSKFACRSMHADNAATSPMG